ncbi:2243_t:CDS:2 [Funneliformis geosporum]|uniref:2243_t:CDS:1 n=1 Tax=Funneliformis geosporum TaxID=1117311 RepID=A0A9W4SRY7_9GLOM|nr:2243_t:CDS:2 [Funneliformis geosporum]
MDEKHPSSCHEKHSQNNNQLTWKQRIEILKFIINAILRIHQENSIHRDLHSGNILYSDYNGGWCISDFGFCGPADKPLGSIYGNLPYIAPEVIFGKGYTFASDIYSIGMLMWEISSGKQPFVGLEHNYDLVMNIMNGMRPKIVSGTPLEYANLMVQSDSKQNSFNIPDKKVLLNYLITNNKVYAAIGTILGAVHRIQPVNRNVGKSL